MTNATYTVRISGRAKFPRLTMSATEGLVVVIPEGFDESRVPSVVARKREWIRRSEERLQEQARFLTSNPSGGYPRWISLRVIGQEWSVSYRATDGRGVRAVERAGQQLLVHGDVDDGHAVADAIRRWLARKTRENVVPWLQSLSRDRGLNVAGVSVRSQRTRWASCSRGSTISLNLRLMFLPQDLVRYALIHELAHIHEMNHSRRYWVLLGTLEPNYRALDERLRTAWRLVPEWVHQR